MITTITDHQRDQLWDYLIDTETATEDELSLVTSINGYNLESLESVLYCRTGLRSLEQIQDMED